MMPVLSDPARSPSTKLVKTPRVLEPELKRSELIGGMIDSDLKKWVDTALAAFDSILGQPNWKRASTRLLHPAERVTARFICTLCSSPSKRCATTESLGVREACAHQCKRNSKVATKRKWKAEYFVPDQKVYALAENCRSPKANLPRRQAICVLSKAVSLLGLRADIRETVVEIESTGARFLCKSCDSPIVMNFQRLVFVVVGSVSHPLLTDRLRQGIAIGMTRCKLKLFPRLRLLRWSNLLMMLDLLRSAPLGLMRRRI